MPDDLTQRGGRDRTHIDVDQEHERRAWSRKFGVSEQQLRDAVRAVGPNAADVEMHLKGVHSTTNSERTRRAGDRPG